MKFKLNADGVTEHTADLGNVASAAFQETRYKQRDVVKANLST